MINNSQNINNTNSYNAKSQKLENQFHNHDISNIFQVDNTSIIINNRPLLSLNEKKETTNQNNIQNISQNINQINLRQNLENISNNKNLNSSTQENINQNNNNINKSNNNILQQNINQETENINNNTNNQILANNNSQVIKKEQNNIENQKNNNQDNNIQITNNNMNNNKSNKIPIKEPLDSIRKKSQPLPKEKFSLRKFIINPNSTLMGKAVPKAMPVYNFIDKGIGISETEEQGIVFCAMAVYQEEIKPLSNNTAKYIQSKLGGDWLVMIYPEEKPIDFNLTLVCRNDFMHFTLDTIAFQVYRLR